MAPSIVILYNKTGLGQNIGPIDKVYCNTKAATQLSNYVLESFNTYLGGGGLTCWPSLTFFPDFGQSTKKVRLNTPGLDRATMPLLTSE